MDLKIFSRSFAESGVLNQNYSLSLDTQPSNPFTELKGMVFNSRGATPRAPFELSINYMNRTVPEPSTYALLAMAGVASAWIAHRRIARSLQSMDSALQK